MNRFKTSSKQYYLLRILTWNINLTQTSDQAPEDWHPTITVHEIHMIIEKEDPDLFTLQEMPTKKFGMRFVDYHQIGSVPSHSGYVGVFARKAYGVENAQLQPPSIVATLTEESHPFHFAGTHLAPYKRNAQRRVEQMGQVMGVLSPRAPLIIAGDMNMRKEETSTMVSAYNFNDAYLMTSQGKNSRFTWDSRVNLFRKGGPPFVCRFDRIFLRDMTVHDFYLVGNEPASENPNHFLSDHFGIVAEVELQN